MALVYDWPPGVESSISIPLLLLIAKSCSNTPNNILSKPSNVPMLLTEYDGMHILSSKYTETKKEKPFESILRQLAIWMTL